MVYFPRTGHVFMGSITEISHYCLQGLKTEERVKAFWRCGGFHTGVYSKEQDKKNCAGETHPKMTMVKNLKNCYILSITRVLVCQVSQACGVLTKADLSQATSCPNHKHGFSCVMVSFPRSSQVKSNKLKQNSVILIIQNHDYKIMFFITRITLFCFDLFALFR